ncbi:MAG: hypothetical protein JO129_03810 [Candidatus Dependentiae bacterium]|nr:hypothetical protein [Candidatus Dependentiae bacterium]
MKTLQFLLIISIMAINCINITASYPADSGYDSDDSDFGCITIKEIIKRSNPAEHRPEPRWRLTPENSPAEDGPEQDLKTENKSLQKSETLTDDYSTESTSKSYSDEDFANHEKHHAYQMAMLAAIYNHLVNLPKNSALFIKSVRKELSYTSLSQKLERIFYKKNNVEEESNINQKN